MQIMQGDAYSIGIDVTLNDAPIDIAMVEKAEIVLGGLAKQYPNEITYDGENGKFLFPITQQESFSFGLPPSPAQIRIKLTTGEVIGGKLGVFDVSMSASKEVL